MFNRKPTHPTINDRFTPRIVRHARFLVVVPLSITLLVACGDEDAPPTPTATAVAPTATTSAATTIATTAANVSTASPVASPSAGSITVGDLADRIGAAWSSVTSYRTTTTTSEIGGSGTSTSAASPAATDQTVIVTIGEVIPPDRKHWVTQANGVTQYEFISVGGQIYGRGPVLPNSDESRDNPNSWFEIDPATVDPNSIFASLFAQLLAPVTAPYTALSTEERARDAVPVEPLTVDGQTCAAYRVADTTQTGERIEIIISLGEDNLPCAIETRVGGQQTVSTYLYNLPLTITAPITASPEAGSS